MNNHVCHKIKKFPLDKFHQLGKDRGESVLIIGESPAPNGWIISGKACYKPDGKILATGKRLNDLLKPFNLSVEGVGFTELSKCFVSKRSELETCSKKCWPIFLEQIKNKKYKLLIILGVKTTQIFSKLIEKELVVGELASITLQEKDYFVLPIFHPSPINPTGQSKNISLFKKYHLKIKKVLI